MSDNKSSKPEVTTPANVPEAGAPVPSIAEDRSLYLYRVEGGRVKASKATGKTAKDRPLIFEPTASATRYTLTVPQARAWMAATDAAERAAIVADASSIETSSAIRPDGTLWAESLAFIAESANLSGAVPVEVLRAMLADGSLLVAAKVRKDRATKAAEDHTEDVLAELFG